jgi:hypothetical protein
MHLAALIPTVLHVLRTGLFTAVESKQKTHHTHPPTLPSLQATVLWTPRTRSTLAPLPMQLLSF